MQKILVICGSQPRHLSILHKLSGSYNVSGIIICKREIVPQLARPKIFKNISDKKLTDHLERLRNDEYKIMGKIDWDDKVKEQISRNQIPVIKVSDRNELNSVQVTDFVKGIHFDSVIDYGSWIIEEKLIKLLTDGGREVFNIHGGISPFFKGSSTLLWALALSQPELMGFTIHSMNENIDDGQIYAYIFPDLLNCSTPTEHMAACQKALYDQINHKFQLIFNKDIVPMNQPKLGAKLFLEKDFRLEILDSLYSIYRKPFNEQEVTELIRRRKEHLGKLSKFI